MRHMLAGMTFATALLAAWGSHAQTSPPDAVPLASPAITAPAQTIPATAMPTKDERKAARQACSDDAKAMGMKGEGRKQAVQACMAQKYPQLAKTQECRKQAKDKGLVKKEMKTFIKECVLTS